MKREDPKEMAKKFEFSPPNSDGYESMPFYKRWRANKEFIKVFQGQIAATVNNSGVGDAVSVQSEAIKRSYLRVFKRLADFKDEQDYVKSTLEGVKFVLPSEILKNRVEKDPSAPGILELLTGEENKTDFDRDELFRYLAFESIVKFCGADKKDGLRFNAFALSPVGGQQAIVLCPLPLLNAPMISDNGPLGPYSSQIIESYLALAHEFAHHLEHTAYASLLKECLMQKFPLDAEKRKGDIRSRFPKLSERTLTEIYEFETAGYHKEMLADYLAAEGISETLVDIADEDSRFETLKSILEPFCAASKPPTGHIDDHPDLKLRIDLIGSHPRIREMLRCQPPRETRWFNCSEQVKERITILYK
jgi:hypothetical protein